ncbi:MAG: hypothetical protein RL660_1594 [Bacteroidota bacterium]|jgi:leucyl/phenylalanyl-tRNA--protein transferase
MSYGISYITQGQCNFPDIEGEQSSDVVAVSEDINPELIISAYKKGAFPWYLEPESRLFHWFAPAPRCVIRPANVHISKSMHRVLRNNAWRFDENASVIEVVYSCSIAPRRPTFSDGILYANDGTWITDEFIAAYHELDLLGYAKAFSVYENNVLIGGLYGMVINKVFFGESMCSFKPNASKYVLINACAWMQQHGIELIDCQMHNDHLQSMGAEIIPFDTYINLLNELT